MKTPIARPNVLAIIFLTALFSSSGLSSAFAQKEVFVRSKPHVNVGTIGGVLAEMRVHANARIMEDGRATGTLQFGELGGESFLFRVVEGIATVERGIVVELILTLERVGKDGASTGLTDRAVVRPSPAAEDCLIYTTIGTDVSVEAEGILGLAGKQLRP